jgi:uncharacterized protein (TIGR02996 family)
MQKHPDADAFMRSYLEHPADAVSRLVFADWLDETCEEHLTAWAHFIRLRIEADRRPLDSTERRELDREADTHAAHIRARLSISASLFVRYPKSLLQLLPAPNITVRLSNFAVTRTVWELIPESVARENLVFPLDLQGRTLLLATTTPHNHDTVQKLQFILNKDIVAVRAELEDIQDAMNREYGQSETESVDSISYESPLIGLEGDAVSGHLFRIFHTAFSSGADSVLVEIRPHDCIIQYDGNGNYLGGGNHPPEVYHRLLEHLLDQEATHEYPHPVDPHLICRDLNVPLLSGRPFPVTLERQEPPDGWFRLRFRW